MWDEVIRAVALIATAAITAYATVKVKAGDSKENPVAKAINAQAIEDAREVARLNRELGRAEARMQELEDDVRDLRAEVRYLRENK